MIAAQEHHRTIYARVETLNANDYSMRDELIEQGGKKKEVTN